MYNLHLLNRSKWNIVSDLFSYFTASIKLPDSRVYKLENSLKTTYPAKKFRI